MAAHAAIAVNAMTLANNARRNCDRLDNTRIVNPYSSRSLDTA